MSNELPAFQDLTDFLSEKEILDDLSSTYGVRFTSISKLDWNVYRVQPESGDAWVARVFKRPLIEVESEIKLVDSIRQHGFPAEVPAANVAVSEVHTGICISVTVFVDGSSPERNRKVFYQLGYLLGQLHSIEWPTEQALISGGAWHHLALGGLQNEIAAALDGLTKFSAVAEPTRRASVEELISRLRSVDLLEGLPQAIVHPDFVPPNVIVDTATGEWTVVDWAGVGWGPRVLSLGYLLFVAAARGKLILVDALMTGYMKNVNLNDAEVERLASAVWTRPFTIACWEVFHSRKDPAAVLEAMQDWMKTADSVVARVRSMLENAASM